MTLQLQLLLLLPFSITAEFTANGFTFSGTQIDETKTQICISGAVPIDTWIGLGIPADPKNLVMLGSELNIIYADANGPQYISGTGNHQLIQDTLVKSTIAKEKSSYSGGVLTVCFDRPNSLMNQISSGFLSLISRFLWATGPVVAGVPMKHISKDGIADVTLITPGVRTANLNEMPPPTMATPQRDMVGMSMPPMTGNLTQKTPGGRMVFTDYSLNSTIPPAQLQWECEDVPDDTLTCTDMQPGEALVGHTCMEVIDDYVDFDCTTDELDDWFCEFDPFPALTPQSYGGSNVAVAPPMPPMPPPPNGANGNPGNQDGNRVGASNRITASLALVFIFAFIIS